MSTDNSQIVNEKVTKPDKNGKTKPVNLYTYDKYFSEEPDANIKPYKVYDALIVSNSFQNKYIKGIPIFSGVTSIQKVQMTPKLRGRNAIEIIEIPPNALVSEKS
ncbi:MAG: spore cortex-lytic protein, partial [Clostridium sp.]|nr:spore cortex-lytic protein [Clostridium sp.]